jgi:hypothetical protein
MRSRWFVVVAALLVALGAARALAQSSGGSVSGTVRDDAGAPLPGATVTLTGDGNPQQGQTGSDGAYAITNVPLGTYRFRTAGPPGFAPFAIDALTVAGDVRQDVTLRRNYADTRAGASLVTDAPDQSAGGCPPSGLTDSDQSTAVRTATPGGTNPRSFTVTLSSAIADPEIRVDPGAGCGAPAAAGLARYDLLASSDGSTFTTVATGTFSPADAGRLNRIPLTGVPATVRAVRLVGRETFGPSDSGYLAISELEVLHRTPTTAGGPAPQPSPTATPTPLVRYDVAMRGKVRPRRDPRPPFRYVARGRLLLPFTVTEGEGCAGKVRITATRNRRFAGGRLAGVESDCTFVHDIPLRRKVLGSRGTAHFILRYQGSLKLKPTFLRVNAAYGPRHPPAQPQPPARKRERAKKRKRHRRQKRGAARTQRPRAASSRG